LGRRYESSIGVLKILSIGAISSMILNVASAWGQAAGNEKSVSVWNIVSVAVHFLLLILFSLQAGALGGAWAFLVGTTIGAVGVLFSFKGSREG